MNSSYLLHQLIQRAAARTPAAVALRYAADSLDYATLAQQIEAFASGLMALGVARAERVGIYLEKRFETVVASFGAPAAGTVFVPVNPLLKADQVGYILRDCNVRVLVTSVERLALLAEMLPQCADLRHVIVVGEGAVEQKIGRLALHSWTGVLRAAAQTGHRVIDTDMLAILYTSGSTGKPKGVVLSHRNMVAGAKSVASYLENNAQDRILSVLPLSFDAGFSQLSTAFHSGAQVVLLNYLMPKDAIRALAEYQITGLTAVPPIWIQLAQLKWPEAIAQHLRYIANTGGHMPRETLNALREKLPRTRPYLMYGLTEAFRSTYLPPNEVDKRPDSIGKAIPNAEILVLREDGTPCAPNEPGELVHRGALVGMGYWNDAEKTAERYKPLQHRENGLMLPEIAVFSGDTVRMDEEGFIYFIGRRDEMMKTSGYRVSPTEIEEVLYATQLVGEAAAFGIAHPRLGHAIVVVITAKEDGTLSADEVLSECRTRLPAYMVPAHVDIRPAPLPRNPNGKIDRKSLSLEFQNMYQDS